MHERMKLRLGGPVFGNCSDPEKWIAQLRALDYRAAYCPLRPGADDDTVKSFASAAAKADILISEVGAWSNPLSPDPAGRKKAIAWCKGALDLADRIGALCCVNISGSRSTEWDGPHPDNLTEETFALIVDITRDIIDSVKPRRTFYTLEPMPWAYPDCIENYERLIAAIDRPRFAVHLDPVNLISNPQLYYDNGAFIRECFARLGPYIKGCHGKDTQIISELTVSLKEVRPGLGHLDYRTFLRELARLDADIPLMLEHLDSAEEYAQAATYVRSIAEETGV